MAVVNITATVAALSSTSGNALRDPLASASVVAASAVTGNALRDPLASASVAAVTTTTAAGTKIHFVTATIAAVTSTSGTMVKGSPVTDAATLSDIRNNLSKVYIQLSNIDLSGIANWEPIRNFTGIFNGNGYTIFNIQINRPGEDDVGLFGSCSFPGNSPNRLIGVTIEGANVVGRDNVGIVSGLVTSSYYNPDIYVSTAFDKIVDCVTSGVVTGRNNVGGVFGLLNNTESDLSNWNWYWEGNAVQVQRCISSAVASGTGINIGGLIGKVFGHFVRHSRALGQVDGGDEVGGLIGVLDWAAAEDVYATGKVFGAKTVGGLVGRKMRRAKVNRVYAEGDVRQTDETFALPQSDTWLTYGAGGLIGFATLEFINSAFAFGDVSGRAGLGGLVGACDGGDYATPNFNCVFAQGNVAGICDVGGLIGFNAPSVDTRVWQAYCSGAVVGEYNRGAVVGRVFRASGYPHNNRVVVYAEPVYYNSDVNTAPNTWGGVGKTTAQLGYFSTYEWTRFDSIWAIDIEENPYPLLRWNYDPARIFLAAVMGSVDQGLMLAYSYNDKVYRQAFKDAVWSASVEVPELEGSNALSLMAADGRVIFVADSGNVDSAEHLKCAISAQNALNIEYVKQLPKGSYGSMMMMGEDSIKLFLVNSVESLSESEFHNLSAKGWENLEFPKIDTIHSDSYISYLKGAYHEQMSYLVWRSRGQHRILIKDEASRETEERTIEGTITMRLDSPIVNGKFELEAIPIYNVEFVVADRNDGTPVVAASIAVESATKVTDVNGRVIFTLESGVYAYNITSDFYESVMGSFSLIGPGTTIQESMVPIVGIGERFRLEAFVDNRQVVNELNWGPKVSELVEPEVSAGPIHVTNVNVALAEVVVVSALALTTNTFVPVKAEVEKSLQEVKPILTNTTTEVT